MGGSGAAEAAGTGGAGSAVFAAARASAKPCGFASVMPLAASVAPSFRMSLFAVAERSPKQPVERGVAIRFPGVHRQVPSSRTARRRFLALGRHVVGSGHGCSTG